LVDTDTTRADDLKPLLAHRVRLLISKRSSFDSDLQSDSADCLLDAHLNFTVYKELSMKSIELIDSAKLLKVTLFILVIRFVVG
jgi:hypothetical protein